MRGKGSHERCACISPVRSSLHSVSLPDMTEITWHCPTSHAQRSGVSTWIADSTLCFPQPRTASFCCQVAPVLSALKWVGTPFCVGLAGWPSLYLLYRLISTPAFSAQAPPHPHPGPWPQVCISVFIAILPVHAAWPTLSVGSVADGKKPWTLGTLHCPVHIWSMVLVSDSPKCFQRMAARVACGLETLFHGKQLARTRSRLSTRASWGKEQRTSRKEVLAERGRHLALSVGC